MRGLRSRLVGLKFLLTRPHERFRLRLKRMRDWRAALAPHLQMPTSARFRSAAKAQPRRAKCASKAFFVFLWKFSKFTKPLSGLIEPNGRSGGICGFLFGPLECLRFPISILILCARVVYSYQGATSP